jgi:hypothetical protein
MKLWQKCIAIHIHVLDTGKLISKSGSFPCLLLSAECQALGPLVHFLFSFIFGPIWTCLWWFCKNFSGPSTNKVSKLVFLCTFYTTIFWQFWLCTGYFTETSICLCQTNIYAILDWKFENNFFFTQLTFLFQPNQNKNEEIGGEKTISLWTALCLMCGGCFLCAFN